MSKTVFTKVDYDLGTLVKYISLGEIGLPDIQRPFVWKNAKVRDLFDSMYKGYPVGYFLFWQSGLNAAQKQIGVENKQKTPRLLIVDGQQRLTSLYAVLKGIEVWRSNFKKEKIQIAFNPLEEKFEVYDAAIGRDSSYLPSISKLWNEKTRLSQVIRDYTSKLKESREVSEIEERKIESSIEMLKGLTGFPFTALELAPGIAEGEEEAVADVFVRINSKGTPLKQSDFILTLMSVFWDEGRTDLEEFCREARTPSKGTASSFNYFIEPSPDQLLKVAVGLAFKRARLKYIYSILRGKDLQTEKFSDEMREHQFALLKDAQSRTLNRQYWHDFLKCVRLAGFRSAGMISSRNNLLFSYLLYLIGRTEFKIADSELRPIIARWFFMAAITGRYTNSPESVLESDLARLRDVNSKERFVELLIQLCEIRLTNDFWSVTLPSDLATSSSQSPSLYAYHASLVLLDATALFSKSRLSDLLDPSINANKSAVEKHHLFPLNYLKSRGFTSIRDTNQIADIALVEWSDNLKISDQAPADYLPKIKEGFSKAQLESMCRLHALPENWENMEYKEFLVARRELMAKVIEDGYKKLTGFDVPSEEKTTELGLAELLKIGESDAIEFKSTLRMNLHTGQPDPRMELSVLKTLAAFLNTNGGTLVVGVSDDGTSVGIDVDGFGTEDKMSLHLVNIVKSRMLGGQPMTVLHPRFEDKDDCRVMVIKCDKSPTPVYVKDEKVERFYIRTGPSTVELAASQTAEFIQHHFKR
ncbi:MAG: DUF262 domain-containing protein [Planctomycetes bacterium]|nr:DUF262 domain-containing protein [Planctomycetota bacterium]